MKKKYMDKEIKKAVKIGTLLGLGFIVVGYMICAAYAKSVERAFIENKKEMEIIKNYKNVNLEKQNQ